MDKTKEKKETRPHYDKDVIEALQKIHGYTAHYIRMSIRGDRVGIMPDRLKKEYHQMANAAKQAKEEKLNQILKD